MANTAPEPLQFRRFLSVADFLRTLEDQRLLESRQKFSAEFLKPLISHLKQNGDKSYFSLGNERILYPEILRVLREAASDSDFFKFIAKWRLEKKLPPLEEEKISAAIEARSELFEYFIDTNKISEPLSGGEAREVANKLQEFNSLLASLVDETSEEEPNENYGIELESSLNTAQGQLDVLRQRLGRILTQRPNSLKLEAKTQTVLEQRINALTGKEKKDAEKKRDDLLASHLKKTVVALDAWQKSTLEKEKDAKTKIQQIESKTSPVTLEGLPNQPGLLELLFDTVPESSRSSKEKILREAISKYAQGRINTLSAEADVEKILKALENGVEQLEEWLRELKKKLIEEREAELAKEISAAFSLSVAGATTPSSPAEGGSDQTPSPAAPPTSVVSVLESEIPQQPEGSTKEEKLRQISTISRDKFTFVQFTLSELRQDLMQQGYSEEAANQYVAAYEGHISSQIWLEILKQDGLHETLSLANLATAARDLVKEYSQIIQKAYPTSRAALPPISSLNEDERLARFLQDNNIDPSLFSTSFSRAQVQNVLKLSNDFANYSYEQRVTEVLQLISSQPEFQRFDQRTRERIVTFLVSSASGGSVGQVFFLNELSGLSPAEQAQAGAALRIFVNNLDIFALIFGLPELRHLQNEIASLQQLGQQLTKAQANSFADHPLFQYVRSLAPTHGDQPQKRGTNDELIEIQQIMHQPTRYASMQVSLIFELIPDSQKDIQETLLTLVASQSVSMNDFSSLLRFSQNPDADVLMENGRLLAAYQSMASDYQSNPQGFAVDEQAAMQQFAESEYQQKRQAVLLKTLMAAAQAGAGNPLALAKLLADGQTRAVLFEELKRKAPALLTIGGTAVGAPIVAVLQPIIQAISAVSNFISGIGAFLSGIGSAITGASASGALAEGATAAQLAAAKEATAALQTVGSTTTTLATVPTAAVSTALATVGVTKSLASSLLAALLIPMIFIGVLTIIVITVIGGSLNDLPNGFLRSRNLNGRVCWPTDGTITQLDADHEKSPGGSAIDIGGQIGTPAYTSFSGQVTKSGWDTSGYGWMVKIHTDQGFDLIFGHFISASPLTIGQRVEAGTQVGSMGNTGNVIGPTGVHLHYESIGINIQDIVPTQPPLAKGNKVSSNQCENFGPEASSKLIALTQGGGGYAFIFNQGFDIVTQAGSPQKTAGEFGTDNQLVAAINTNFYEAGSTVLGVSSDGTDNLQYDTNNQPMEGTILFLKEDSLPANVVNLLHYNSKSGSRVLYNQNGVAIIDLFLISAEGQNTIKQQILPLTHNAISGLPILKSDFNPALYTANDPNSTKKLPRTIFGVRDSATGPEFGLIVVKSADYWDLNNVMTEAGFSIGLGLDGDTSSQLYVQGKDFSEETGAVDSGGAWHPTGSAKAVPALIGVKAKN